MRSTLLTLLTAATALALALATPEQSRAQLSVELRGSLNQPVGEFSGREGLDAGSEAGLGADLVYAVNNYLSVYGGWGTEMFSCEGCADDDGITSSGFEGGLKLLRYRTEGVLPWLKAGLTAHTLEVESGSFEAESDRNVGFQVAAGADIPLGDVLSFSPALRYQVWDADFDVVGGDAALAEQRPQHLSLDVGLHIHLSALGSG